MKHFFLSAITLFFLLSLTACKKETAAKSKKQSGAGIAMDQFAKMRMYPEGAYPNRNYIQAFDMKQSANFSRGSDQAKWEGIGPKNIGGRATCFEFHPLHPDTIYLGTASGGLWRTNTAGKGVNAWEQVPTGHPVAGVGAIAIDPTDADVMYLGTGEVYNVEAAAPGVVNRLTRGIPGIGILKSEDGGQSWSPSLDWRYEDRTGIQDLLINPANSNTVFAATTNGLYRTHDAGQNWIKLDSSKMAVDIEMHPQDTSIIFVTYGNMNAAYAAIHRSTDGGNSFQKLSNGLPPFYTGKTMLSISESNPRTIYASVANEFESIGLFKSIDKGDSWSNINAQDVARYQGWFAHDVVVNPQDEDEIIYVGVDAYRSLDGGITISQEGFWYNWYLGQVPVGGPEGPPDYVHADIHMARYHPTQADVVYLATDGGFFTSMDNGNNWEGRNGGLQTQQFYANFSNSTTDSLLAIGGMQDNATAIFTGDDAWTRVIGGDGMCTAINPQDDRFIYGSAQFLNIYLSQNRGANFDYISPLANSSEQATFSAPFELAPSGPDTVYAGAQKLFRSTDGGLSWHVPYNRWLDGTNSIQNIAVSPYRSTLLYVSTAAYELQSTDKPKLFKSTDASQSFTLITGLPDRHISDIAIHPSNDDIVYVVLSGFGTNHVYKTEDAGTTWQAMDNAQLPDVPTSSLVIDPAYPDYIYVGNDAGVWFSADGGMNWEAFVKGLPEAAIAFHLSISPANQKLRVATHGNGVFQSPLVAPAISSALDSGEESFAYLGQNFPNPARGQSTIRYELKYTAEVNISLYDLQGKLIETYPEGQKNAGSHTRVVDVASLAAGIYLYELEVKQQGKTVKMSKRLIKR